MSHAHFEVFLADSTREGTSTEKSLSPDQLYGLYTSWCFLNKEKLHTPDALWQALRKHQIEPASNQLVMTGPAAVNYIITSAPNIV